MRTFNIVLGLLSFGAGLFACYNMLSHGRIIATILGAAVIAAYGLTLVTAAYLELRGQWAIPIGSALVGIPFVVAGFMLEQHRTVSEEKAAVVVATFCAVGGPALLIIATKPRRLADE